MSLRKRFESIPTIAEQNKIPETPKLMRNILEIKKAAQSYPVSLTIAATSLGHDTPPSIYNPDGKAKTGVIPILDKKIGGKKHKRTKRHNNKKINNRRTRRNHTRNKMK
jgi:hypothetical protein